MRVLVVGLRRRGEGLGSYMVALGVIMAAFVPILLTLANSGVSPLISRLTSYLGTVTFP